MLSAAGNSATLLTALARIALLAGSHTSVVGTMLICNAEVQTLLRHMLLETFRQNPTNFHLQYTLVMHQAVVVYVNM